MLVGGESESLVLHGKGPSRLWQAEALVLAWQGHQEVSQRETVVPLPLALIGLAESN